MMLSALEDVARPTPVVDEVRARVNVASMAGKARRSGLRFRPHFKTHQSAGIGEWFRDEGVSAIAVSSLGMAAYFAEAGWDDITVAFPFNPREIALARQLASRVQLGLLIDSDAALDALAHLDAPASVWIKIDTGYGRAGIFWERAEAVAALARRLRSGGRLEFAGILTHNGMTYSASGREEILSIHDLSLERMRAVAAIVGDCPISIGDTPACVLADDFEGADEIRPGNFVFFDLMQRALGVCEDSQIALALACPVVGVQKNRALLYGGAVHFSKEALDVGARKIYGCLAGKEFGEVDDFSPLISLSQEHGTLEAGEGTLAGLKSGDLVLVYPVHSCLTADLHSAYRTLDGNVIPKWKGGR